MSRNASPIARAKCNEFVSVPVPERLKTKLRQLSDLESSTLAATARRLIALGVKTELARLGAVETAVR